MRPGRRLDDQAFEEGLVEAMDVAVVVPTPPLAPMNAKTWPPDATTGRLWARSRVTAVSTSAACSGSATHSLTPARIASRTIVDSSVDVTSRTGVVGC
jgi:hypothetical protein